MATAIPLARTLRKQWLVLASQHLPTDSLLEFGLVKQARSKARKASKRGASPSYPLHI